MIKPEVLTLPTYKHLVYVCRDQEQFDWVAKKYEVYSRPWLLNNQSLATTHIMRDKLLVVVCLPKNKLTAKHAAIAAHEAVHVAQFIFENIGESNPGDEAEAYLVEQVTEFLLSV